MEWITKVYTDGLMNTISYTELESSFVAYVALHQYLCQLSDIFHRGKSFTSVYVGMAHFFRDFDAAFEEFLTKIKKMSFDDAIESYELYETQLHALYKNFLVKLIHDHHVYLKERLRGNLKRLEKTGFQKLDMLDRSFLALQKEWPTFESHEHKYQFETVYARPANDGLILLLGYNEHDFSCDRLLHIYTWDIKNENNNPVQIKYKNMDFDFSPVARAGGCGYRVYLNKWPENNIVDFDGRILTFYGHDYATYRRYAYDLKTNQWKIQENP